MGGKYTNKKIYTNGIAPAINATNLNSTENQIEDNTNQIGRIQSEFGFVNATLTDVTDTNGEIELGDEIIGSALNRGADTGTSGTTQQRGLKLTTNKALVGIKCQISANATGYTVAYLLDASKSQIATQVITGLSEFTFVYNFLNATTYYIVVDDGAGAYTSGYKVVSYPFAGTEFNIISGYDNGNDISNLAYNINNLQGIETLGTLGTIEKTYSAQGLEKY
jgi:hypothetical protein